MSTVVADRLRSPRGPDAASSGPRTYSRAKWLGILGIALGVLAFFIAIPPLTVRTAIPSYVIALASAGLGVVAIRAGEKRVGYGAVVAAVVGALGAYGATRSGVTNLEVVVAWGAIAASMLRERKIVVARLQRLGVHIVEAHHERIGTELVNAYLGLKRRNLL